MKSQCRPCGGSGICPHKKRKSICRECGGGSICEHDRLRYQCKVCQHLKRKNQEMSQYSASTSTASEPQSLPMVLTPAPVTEMTQIAPPSLELPVAVLQQQPAVIFETASLETKKSLHCTGSAPMYSTSPVSATSPAVC